MPSRVVDLLRGMAGLSLGLPISRARMLPLLGKGPSGQQQSEQQPAEPHTNPAPSPLPTALSPQDDQFLNDLEHANFLFFWEQANPQTGLTKDRCNVRTNDTTVAASIASTGFGLTAICIGEKRGFVSRADARVRVLDALSFIWHKLPTHRGFFYHFANINTGERIWDSEASSVDTAMLLCGVLTCRQHFQDKDISHLAHAIFDRVDWTWLSEDTTLALPWLDTGARIYPVAVGSIQRTDDDVSSRARVFVPSPQTRCVVCVEADRL